MLDISPLDGIRSPFGPRRGRAFSPSTLFALAEPGVWFDPSDLTTLYQDPAGTTPVTTPGRIVGLMLDKSKGLALGTEKVSNGTFAANVDGWSTLNATITFSSESASVTNTGANGSAYQAIATTVGVFYKVSASTITGAIVGKLIKSDTTSAFGANFVELQNLSGRLVFGFIATAATTYIHLTISTGSTGVTCFFDNISVRELAGNHATQATLASRPIYGIEPVGGRRNLLTYSEAFNEAAWVKTRATATVGALTENSASGVHIAVQDFTYAAGDYTIAVDFKPNGRDWIALQVRSSSSYFGLTGAGSLGDVFGTVISRSITLLPDGYYRCVITVPATAGADNVIIYLASANGTVSYTGNGTSGVLVRNAQLEASATATAYQRVTTQYDVTEAGVASTSYLAFDGVDDGMVTGTITPGVDKVQVFAGVRKLQQSAVGIIAELSADVGSNNGTFVLTDRNSATYAGQSKGTVSSGNVSPTGTYTAPVTNTLTFISDISADTAAFRANGGNQGTVVAAQGTGNFLAYPLYIGRRGGTTLPFSGRIYSLITRFGANLDAGVITNTETWVAGKTGISL